MVDGMRIKKIVIMMRLLYRDNQIQEGEMKPGRHTERQVECQRYTDKNRYTDSQADRELHC